MVKISSEEFDSHSDEIAYLAKIHGGRLKEWTDYEGKKSTAILFRTERQEDCFLADYRYSLID